MTFDFIFKHHDEITNLTIGYSCHNRYNVTGSFLANSGTLYNGCCSVYPILMKFG